MPDLSVLIPSRSEPWLKNTVEDILKNARADTEVIVILDGAWPVEPLAQHEKVTLVYHPKSVGQRAATNEAARLSNAKYVAKCDAHVSFAEGFDVELIKGAQELGPDVTQIALQRNLHVFNLVCEDQKCDWSSYQCPTPKECPKCKGGKFRKELVWQPRRGVKTYAWRFDETLHFQYANDMGQRPHLKHGDFIDTMSCLGAFFFMERERFWKLDGMDEGHGSWGGYGTELGCKSWLSGGRMVTNTRTHFAHLFRTSGGDLSFPYEIHGSDQEKARVYSRKLWLNNAWPGQVRPLSWMLNYFWPVSGWSDAARAKVAEAGVAFTRTHASGGEERVAIGDVVGPLPSLVAYHAASVPIDGRRQDVAPDAMSLPGLGVPDLGLGTARAVSAFPGDAVVAGGSEVTIAVGLDPSITADEARPHQSSSGTDDPRGRKNVTTLAQGASSVQCPDGTSDVVGVRGEREVGDVDARRVVAEMVENGDASTSTVGQRVNQPSEQEPGDTGRATEPVEGGVAVPVSTPGPLPAASAGADAELAEDSSEMLAVQVSDGQNAISHSGPPSQATSRSGAGGVIAPPVPTPHILPPNPRPGIVQYTENRLDPVIASACRKQLVRAANGIPIVSVSINGPCDLGQNIELPYERSYLSMFRQILVGLEAIDADIVFLAEHDVAYHPSHFEFVPPRGDVYYYDLAVWKVDAATGRALHYITRQTSGLCASRSLLLEHYRKRVERVERDGFSRKIGFEPVSHGRAERIDDYGAADWRSAAPNVDIRHSQNLTSSRWAQSEFRSQRNCQGWTDGDAVPGWPGKTLGRFPEWLSDVVNGGK